MQTEEAGGLYRQRAGLGELENAHLKSRFGLDHVLVRGLSKVTSLCRSCSRVSPPTSFSTALASSPETAIVRRA